MKSRLCQTTLSAILIALLLSIGAWASACQIRCGLHALGSPCHNAHHSMAMAMTAPMLAASPATAASPTFTSTVPACEHTLCVLGYLPLQRVERQSHSPQCGLALAIPAPTRPALWPAVAAEAPPRLPRPPTATPTPITLSTLLRV